MSAQEQIRQGWCGILGQIAEYIRLQYAGDKYESIAASELINDMEAMLFSLAVHEGWLQEALSAFGASYITDAIIEAGDQQIAVELPASADEIDSMLKGIGADALESEDIKVVGMTVAPYRIEGLFDGELDLAELNALAKLIAASPDEAILAERYIEQAQVAPADITELMNCIATAKDDPRYDAFTYEELRDMAAAQWERSQLDEPLELHDRLPEDREPIKATIPIPKQRTQAARNPSIEGDARRAGAGAQIKQAQTIEPKTKETSR